MLYDFTFQQHAKLYAQAGDVNLEMLKQILNDIWPTLYNSIEIFRDFLVLISSHDKEITQQIIECEA